MTAWCIIPRDPLVVRDGRPNQGRSESATLAFPAPATVAGVVRTRAGSDPEGRFVERDPGALRAIELRGPLLARMDRDGADAEALYAPAPRDALMLGAGGTRALHALRPLDDVDGALFDEGTPETLVGVPRGEAAEGKVPADLPAWWRWESLERWLAREPATADQLLDGGLRPLPREHRMHVKLGAAGVAEDAMLFETAGLRFSEGVRDLAVFVDLTLAEGQALRPGVGPFGGERRLARWSSSAKAMPAMPDAMRAHLAGDGRRVRVRVVLLTPAWFAAGSTPAGGEGAALGAREGVSTRLVASIVPRPETISGWDFERGGPKPTRRLVPAGSVFWLDLEGSAEDRLRWAEGVWMRNVSDGEQERRDGFGLAVLGVA